MSICPSSDIHSVFVDGELPEEFMKDYLNHINNCPECKKTVNKLYAMKKDFAEDSEKIELSQEKVDDGYAKLETLLNFKQTVDGLDFSRFYPLFNRLIPAVAAALLIVFFLPMRMEKLKNGNQELDIISQSSNFQPVFAQTSIGSIFNDNNSYSLIESAKYLTTLNLENIIEKPQENIYENIRQNVSYQDSEWSNVYNTHNSVYNEVYSPFLGF